MSLNALNSTNNALAADARTLNALKYQASQNSPESIKETAKQFESLFMREMIKSMREATMKSGLLDSPQGDLGADMLDQQLAVQMSGQPGGLSDLIAAQLTRQMGTVDGKQIAAQLVSAYMGEVQNIFAHLVSGAWLGLGRVVAVADAVSRPVGGLSARGG